MAVYQHTQIGTAILGIFALAVAGVGGLTLGAGMHPVPVLVLALILIAAAVFSTLTVRVDENTLTWHFSFGFWTKRLALHRIVRAEPVVNRWWWGLGIRATPRGWLYNVSGLGAVEITDKDGHRLRIGSDQPDMLAAAIRRRLT